MDLNGQIIEANVALQVFAGARVRFDGADGTQRLEWFFRPCVEPRRLFSRYLIRSSLFPWRTPRVRHSIGLPHSLRERGNNRIQLIESWMALQSQQIEIEVLLLEHREQRDSG